MYDSNNEFIGSQVTWDVVTDKLRNETNMARLSAMVESSPSNIMYCDLDYNITYANPKSLETLKQIQQYLPIPVDKIVGSSIDIFHKNPKYQRDILANPNNLPRRAIINVGPEKLDLLVSPIFDQNQSSIGTMVTWDVVTDKIRLEFESARITSMMENAPINVIYCDRDFNITYMNPASIETLKTIEQYLPVRVDEVVGSSIDIFHKNPAHQRNMLADDRNFPHRATISVGPERPDLLVSAIYDKDKNYIGSMVTWDVITEKLKSEKELARIRNMVENAPVNIMMADRDFRLIYMNPKAEETLRKLERFLPRRVDQLKGESIDIFYKRPEVNRAVVSDPKNLPHRAKVKVGDETLDLLVSAIFDAKGEYLGPTVTWEIITSKVNLVEQLTEASQQLSAAANELNATATEMNSNAEETSAQANSAATAAEEVSKGVEAVATNTEEMNASIKEIARNANEASVKLNDTKTQAEQTNKTISQLGESSKEIGNVIKVISSIAQQTNLLALNATIEAARAGDAGRGFSVVANEVKELAKQTANATEEITNKISAIQKESDGAVAAIQGIGGSIEKLNSIAGAIAASVEEQMATTNEVSRVVQESNTGVQGIADNVKQVSTAATSTSSGATQLVEADRAFEKVMRA